MIMPLRIGDLACKEVDLGGDDHEIVIMVFSDNFDDHGNEKGSTTLLAKRSIWEVPNVRMVIAVT